LLAERDGEWDASEVPQLYFNRVEKAIQGLTRARINSDLNERRDMRNCDDLPESSLFSVLLTPTLTLTPQ
jgi:hypothetical protein